MSVITIIGVQLITRVALRAQCKRSQTGYHVEVTRVTRVAQSKSAINVYTRYN